VYSIFALPLNVKFEIIYSMVMLQLIPIPIFIYDTFNERIELTNVQTEDRNIDMKSTDDLVLKIVQDYYTCEVNLSLSVI